MLLHLLRYLVQNILSIPLRLAFFLFASFEVRGRENLLLVDQKAGVIFAANHKSQLDPLAVVAGLQLFSALLPLYFVSIESKYYDERRLPIGKYLYGSPLFKALFGSYPIKKGLKNYAETLKQHEELLHDGRSVCIFPEGRRIYEEGMGEAHGGVSFLAHKTGAAIIPVLIEGTLFSGYIRFFTFRQKIRVTFGKPVYFEEIEPGNENEHVNFKAAAENLMQKIAILSL